LQLFALDLIFSFQTLFEQCINDRFAVTFVRHPLEQQIPWFKMARESQTDSIESNQCEQLQKLPKQETLRLREQFIG
jgi:hypothetical protein